MLHLSVLPISRKLYSFLVVWDKKSFSVIKVSTLMHCRLVGLNGFFILAKKRKRFLRKIEGKTDRIYVKFIIYIVYINQSTIH